MAPLARRTEQSNLDAFDAYRPEPYDGSVTLITAATRTPGLCDPLPVWRRAVQGDLTVERVAGGHHEIVAEPRVRVLADRIAAHLDKPSQAD
jgi:thioesterase domain-containing protein